MISIEVRVWNEDGSFTSNLLQVPQVPQRGEFIELNRREYKVQSVCWIFKASELWRALVNVQ